ncbi:hypothetical protein F5051DRAFT_435985 [Lentinula edodes]|nr:hypothetical protein F5051DRAFT_435985 [Lentinula edodes]
MKGTRENGEEKEEGKEKEKEREREEKDGTEKEETTNERIIRVLEQARTHETLRADRDRYRIRALNRAMKEIGYLEREIRDEGEVEELKGVGGMKRELKGVVRGVLRDVRDMRGVGDMREGKEGGRREDGGLGDTGKEGKGEGKRAKDQARMRIVHELLGVPGLGLTTAKELVHLGVTSIHQLQHYLHLESSPSPSSPSPNSPSPNSPPSPSSPNSPSPPHPLHPLSSHLTKTQLTNLRYLTHILHPASRSDITRVHALIKALLPPQYEVVCVGAYRRGFPISQRVDVCLFHPLFGGGVGGREVPRPGVGVGMGGRGRGRPREREREGEGGGEGEEGRDYLTNISLKTPIPRKHSATTTTKLKPDRRGRVELAFRSPAVIPGAVRARSMFLNEVVPALKAGGLVPQGDGSGGDGEISVGQWKWTGVVRIPEVVNQGEEQGEGEGEGKLELESLRSRLLALRSPHPNTNPQNVFRKLDLSMAPMPSKATALLFLTGDVEFVRDMRMRADRMGLVLNEFGLWRWDSEGDSEGEAEGEEGSAEGEGEGETEGEEKEGEEEGVPSPTSSDRHGSWTLIPTPTEHALFAALGIEYIPPEKRNFSFLLSRWSKATGRLRRGGEEGAGVGVVLRS